MRTQRRVIGFPNLPPAARFTSTAPDNVVLIYWIFCKQHNQRYPVFLPILMEGFEYYKPITDTNEALFPFSLPSNSHIWRAKGGSYLFQCKQVQLFQSLLMRLIQEKKKKTPNNTAHCSCPDQLDKVQAFLKWSTLLGTASLLSSHQHQAAGGPHARCLLRMLFLLTHSSLMIVLFAGT